MSFSEMFEGKEPEEGEVEDRTVHIGSPHPVSTTRHYLLIGGLILSLQIQGGLLLLDSGAFLLFAAFGMIPLTFMLFYMSWRPKPLEGALVLIVGVTVSLLAFSVLLENKIVSSIQDETGYAEVILQGEGDYETAVIKGGNECHIVSYDLQYGVGSLVENVEIVSTCEEN